MIELPSLAKIIAGKPALITESCTHVACELKMAKAFEKISFITGRV